jgi:hypothetical protein
MCRQKPNGSARIILNLSAPEGASVNDGICADDFPAVMSSTAKWLEVLDRAGKGALIMKADWSDAYKHVAVRGEDVRLQWFSWLGKYFAELGCEFLHGLRRWLNGRLLPRRRRGGRQLVVPSPLGG